MTTKEIHKGKTPNGGVLSEIYYMDENRKPVDKKDARLAIVRELDEKGNLVYETFATIKR